MSFLTISVTFDLPHDLEEGFFIYDDLYLHVLALKG